MLALRRLLALTLAGASTALAAANASDSETYTEMASTMLQFSNAGLIPEVIPQDLFSLSAALQVSYGNYSASLGDVVDPKMLNVTPTFQLNYTGAVQQQQVFWSQLFTVLAFDAGYPGSAVNETSGIWRQYLANNMTVTQQDGILRNMTSALTEWQQPNITAGSGPHRIVQLVFAQGPEFQLLQNYTNTTGSAPANMSLSDYVEKSSLGKIVAANYFIVQNGTTAENVPVSSTQAVPAASVTAMASQISASIIAEGTRAVLIKDSAAGPMKMGSGAAALALVGAVGVASAVALLI